MVAIIPAAGRGTRMSEVAGGKPKELLKLGSKSVLLRVLLEARSADPDEIVVVSSPEKAELDEAVTAWSKGVLADVPIRIVHQFEADGAAPAIADAEIADDVLILLGDCVFSGASPINRMANLLLRGIDGCIAVESVADQAVRRYGITEIDEGTGAIRRILEKPAPDQTASRWAVAARLAMSKPMSGFFIDYCTHHRSSEREIPVTEVFQAAIDHGMDVRAVPLQGDTRRVDCGSPEEYGEALRMRWD
jgi:dTDP-glucose pyrophosphorylase